MTKREAIRECKRLWKEIEKSGKSKYNFLHTKDGKKWEREGYRFNCPLCEYSGEVEAYPIDRGYIYEGCENKCPLFKQYNKGCYDLGFETCEIPSKRWLNYIKGLKE